jgi:hypothetical protein
MSSAALTPFSETLNKFGKIHLSLDILRDESALAAYKAAHDEVIKERVETLAQGPFKSLTHSPIPLAQFFVDTACAVSLASGLQVVLSEILQGHNQSRGLPQEQTHLLVDLWGQVESLKALYEYVGRKIASGVELGVSIQAQCRVLLQSTQQTLLTISMRMAEHYGSSAVAPIVDWGLAALKSPVYGPLNHAIDTELYGLVA